VASRSSGKPHSKRVLSLCLIAAAKEIPRRERLAARPNLDELFSGVLNDRTARNKRIYQAVRVHEYTGAEVQELLGLHYSTISISVIAKRVAEEKKHQK